MSRSVTVKEIAQATDVSIATVSRVLNNHDNIKEDLRQRVLQEAARLGYFRIDERRSSAIKDKQTLKTIGFLLNYNDPEEPSQESSFWAHILHGAEREAHKANISMMYRSFATRQPAYVLLSTLHEAHLGGLLLVGPSQPDVVEAVAATNAPLVLIDNVVRLPTQPIDAVLCDNFGGAKEAVSYLIHKGHRQIAFLGGYTSHYLLPTKIYTFELRKEGYFSALRDAGLALRDSLVASCNILQYEDVLAACTQLLATNHDVSALFCVNDTAAGWAMKAFRELGRRIPEDISIVGFDDIDLAEHLTPALTTIYVDKAAMGAVAVKSLIARAIDPHTTSSTTILDVKLIERQSVRSLL